jgi:glycerol-3-phosphate dehydrogenase
VQPAPPRQDEAGVPDRHALEIDLLVVGGGINGAGIARDAAGRGLSVCLVEQDDLAAHTSSASTKLIHGGLRYLEQFELRLVREALAERERLLAIAPHIIRPQRFVLPYVAGLRPRWLLRLGLYVYDHAGGREQLAASQAVDLAGNALGVPLRPEMQTGFEYSDCWVDDARLVLLNALDAAERGACVLTRTRLLSARATADGWLAVCEDRPTGRRRALRARAIVNATGAWGRSLLSSKLGLDSTHGLRLVKGSHLVVRRLYEGDHAYLLQSPDRRVVFAIPYEGDFTLIGTTDVPFDGDPACVAVDDAEVGYLCDCVNRFFSKPLNRADIVWRYAGVRALYDSGASSAQEVSRDYRLELDHGESGAPVLSVFGGKITTYRRLAEAALEQLLPSLGASDLKPWTDQVALPGGDMPNGDIQRFTEHARVHWDGLPAAQVERLARLYGTRMARILGAARNSADLGEDLGGGLTHAEVAYLVLEEWARSAEDILWRRTKAGLHGADAARVEALVASLRT